MDRPAKARAEGSFHGCGFTSDESTPNSSKFSGLRFQVTFCHTLLFLPVEQWAESRGPPIRRQDRACDLAHVAVKTGAETLRIIEKQIGRLGLTRFDLKSGTGDGGGENEGASGVS